MSAGADHLTFIRDPYNKHMVMHFFFWELPKINKTIIPRTKCGVRYTNDCNIGFRLQNIFIHTLYMFPLFLCKNVDKAKKSNRFLYKLDDRVILLIYLTEGGKIVKRQI